MCGPVFDSCIYDRILVRLIWDYWVAAFEKVLIDAAFVVEYLKRRLQPLGAAVDFVRRQAFVIHSLHREHDSYIAALSQKCVVVHESEQIGLLVQRTGFAVAFQSLRQPKHHARSEPALRQTSWDRTECGPLKN